MYMRAALVHTAGCRRHITPAESWIDDWSQQLNRLADFLDRPGLAQNREVRARTERIVDASLWHHRREAESLPEVLRAYGQLVSAGDLDLAGVVEQFDAMLPMTVADARSGDARLRHSVAQQRRRLLETTREEITATTEAGSRIILIDDDGLGEFKPRDRHLIPCTERNGEYWGSPADGTTAVREIRRLLASGVDYVVITANAFWWFEHFPEFNKELRYRFPCIFNSENTIVFRTKYEFQSDG